MQKSTSSHKSTKRNIIKSKVTKNEGSDVLHSPWLEDYLDCFTFKLKPVTEAFIDRISSELVEWAYSNPHALKLSQFFNEKRIPKVTYERWFLKYEKLDHARNIAKSMLGDRRECGAIERKYDAGTIGIMMPNYDPDWKENIEWRAKLKAQADANVPERTVVVLEAITETKNDQEV